MYYDQPITNREESRTGMLDRLRADEPYPGVTRRGFDSQGATVTAYAFEPGATFPLHHHPQEQITVVQRGDLEMTIGDSVQTLSAGAWSVVAPGVVHGITAGADGAELLAIVIPGRERSDAYRVVEPAE